MRRRKEVVGNMDQRTESLELKIIEAMYGIEKSRGHLGEMEEREYFELMKKEKEIVNNPRPNLVPVESVIEDLQRYCSRASRLLSNAFLENTIEGSRIASVAGREGKLVYLSVGDYIHNGEQYELGLLSAHAPGTSGGGSWGMDGDRRLIIKRKEPISKLKIRIIDSINKFSDKYLRKKINIQFRPIDPEKWLEYTGAYVGERFNELEYKDFKDPEAKALLYKVIENQKLKIK